MPTPFDKDNGIEEICNTAPLVFYTGESMPKNLIAIMPKAYEDMQKLVYGYKKIQEQRGSFFEFGAIMLGSCKSGITIINEYFFPKSIATNGDELISGLVHGGFGVDCLLSKKSMGISDSFYNRASRHAINKGMEIIGIDHVHPQGILPSYADLTILRKWDNILRKKMLIVRSGRDKVLGAYIISDNHFDKVKKIAKSYSEKNRDGLLDLFPLMKPAVGSEAISGIISEYLSGRQ